MFRFFFKKPKPSPPQKNFELLPRGHTLLTWRSSPELHGNAKKVFDEPVMAHVFSVLYNEIPCGFPLRGQPVNDIQAAIELGRMNGYIECLSLLKSLPNTPEKTEEIEQDYGSTDRTTEWQ